MLFPERLRRISRRNRTSRRDRPARRDGIALALLIVVAVTTTVVACTGGGNKDDASDAPQLSLPPPSFDDIPVVTLPEGFVQPDTRAMEGTGRSPAS